MERVVSADARDTGPSFFYGSRSIQTSTDRDVALMSSPRIGSFTRAALAGLLLLATSNTSATAQGPDGSGQQRFIENQLRPLIAPEFQKPTGEDRLLINHGAVLRSLTAWYEDHGTALSLPQESRALHIAEIRPWASLTYGNIHRGFFRGQLGYLTFNDGDQYGTRDRDTQGPYVDLAYYEFDVDAAMQQAGIDQLDDFSGDLTIGRQFLYLGQGITFGLTTDAVSFDWSHGDWGGLAFGSQAVDRNVNFNGFPNPLAYQLDRRRFYGGQLEYQGWDRRELYSYVLAQWDNSSRLSASETAYDSIYWGVGTAGEMLFGEPGQEIGIPNLRYHSEFVLQRGDHQDFTEKDDIEAWAVDAGLDYFWTTPMKPRVGFTYAKASGDKTRVGSPLPNAGLNAPGTTDDTFIGFGYMNTGVSFQPSLSNLEFVRFSAALRPFDDADSPSYQGIEVGTSAYLYWRPAPSAGVSDVRADTNDDYLGYECDLHVNWRMSSDLFLLVNYGVFVPHDGSFSPGNERSRQFFTVNLNWLL